MIELYRTRRGKLRLNGYITEDLKFIHNNGDLLAYVKGNIVYFHTHEIVYKLNENKEIISEERGKLGYMNEFKVYDNYGEMQFYYKKNTQEVVDPHEENVLYQLQGDIETLDQIMFLGLCFAFCDLFC